MPADAATVTSAADEASDAGPGASLELATAPRKKKPSDAIATGRERAIFVVRIVLANRP
jgi:hypothetical protein